MEIQYYRTFIALPVRAGEDLLQLRREIMTRLEEERISWVDPQKFHVTLRFLGDTSLADVEKISEAMTSDKFLQDSRLVPVTGVDSFGPARNPRVIWVSFGEARWFRELKTEVDQMLENLGFPAENQAFTAHLTLGRIRSLGNVTDFHAFMAEMKARSFSPARFEKMVYYRSELGTGPPRYSKLAEIIFSGK